ncbi:MAG: 16S rRNA (guanine(966)-N(2))-methyltransferase RsmD [bacterium]
MGIPVKVILRQPLFMRVIGGKYKRRELLKLPARMRSLRPTYDRIREDIFNIISGSVSGARFLDLYAGTGCVGIEAISRGASAVTFVDSHPMCAQIIRRNCERLGIPDSAVRIIQKDVFNFLESVDGEKYDIIFIDPPYAGGLFDKTLDLLGAGEYLSPDGIIIGQNDRKIEGERRGRIAVKRQLKCGRTFISFWKKTAKGEDDEAGGVSREF